MIPEQLTEIEADVERKLKCAGMILEKQIPDYSRHEGAQIVKDLCVTAKLLLAEVGVNRLRIDFLESFAFKVDAMPKTELTPEVHRMLSDIINDRA